MSKRVTMSTSFQFMALVGSMQNITVGARFKEVLDLLQSWGQGLSTGYDAGLDGMAVPLVNDTDELVRIEIWMPRGVVWKRSLGMSPS